MKSKFKIKLFAIIVILISLGSCKKFLDQVPDDTLSIDDIFNSKEYVDEYLAQIYANLPNTLTERFAVNGWGGGYSGPWTSAADEADYTYNNYSNQMNLSTWSSSDGAVSTLWNNWYKSIRNASDFIDKIDGANSSEITDATKRVYKAEARALRAMYYFWLVRLYGPVPLITTAIPADAALVDVLKARTPMDSCIDFISTQLDTAYTDLRTTPLNNEWGRITKGVVKAYKAEALLLNASPLFNGNADMATLKNLDGTQLINQTYDPNKWKDAADAAKAFIDEFVPSVYDLYTESASDSFTAAYLACRDVMMNSWNKEWIYARPNSGTLLAYDNTPFHSGYTDNTHGAGFHGATQKIVDAYFMKNGLSITNSNSGYVSTGFSDFQAPFDVKSRNTYNQWVNREPRFYVGITYNSSYWLYQNNNDNEVVTTLATNGNSGRSQSTSDVSKTGYIVRKNTANTASDADRGALLIRLAQIYLDYVESLNEYDPGNADILKYLNLIRVRAGIPAYGSVSIPVPTSQSAMRDAIRHERQVELAFESVRYFDCHRWKISFQTDNGPFYGMNMYGGGNDFYTPTVFETRVFKQRDYLWPIPNNEVLINNLLVQNPGW